MGIFTIENLLAACAWITFAPIDDEVQKYYGGITSQQVNWLSLIFMALYGPGTYLCAFFIRKYGFRETVVVSALIMGIGGLLRWWSVYFIDENNKNLAYIILFTGQSLVALSQAVFQNAPAHVASAWFQQTAATIGIIVLGSMIGMLAGQGLTPFLGIDRLDQWLATQAIAMVVCAIASCIYFESEPKLPPTAAEAARRQQHQHQHQCRQHQLEHIDSNNENDNSSSTTTILHDVLIIFSDIQYLILLVAFGIQYGINNGTSSRSSNTKIIIYTSFLINS